MGKEEESRRQIGDTGVAELLWVSLNGRLVSSLRPLAFPTVPRFTFTMTSATGGPKVGQIIRKARIRKGLTQVELAELTGVGRETVGNWENDRTSPDGALPRIEEALDITLSEGEEERIAEAYTMEALLDRLRAAEREIDRARTIARRIASGDQD